MPLNLAQMFAYNLAVTLMVTVVLFQTDSGYGVLIEAEFDGDSARIIHLYDPYEG